GAGGTVVTALQQAGGTAAAAKAEGEPGSRQAARPVAATIASEPPAAAPQEELAQKIALAELHVKRAEERVAWSDRMFEKGYVSKAQNIADKQALKLAELALEVARTQLEMSRLRGAQLPDDQPNPVPKPGATTPPSAPQVRDQ